METEFHNCVAGTEFHNCATRWHNALRRRRLGSSVGPVGDGAQHRGEIRKLLSDHGHRPNPAYGQNFLAEPAIVESIVDAADVDRMRVVEVGAGTGTLTAALSERAASVVAYEVDRHLEPVLVEALSGLAVDIRIADATTVDWCDELDGEGWIMVANLPYNVGTGIVLDVLQEAPCIERLVVMVQREVADRFLAQPGSRTFGVPSVIVSLHADARVALRVPPGAFTSTQSPSSLPISALAIGELIDILPCSTFASSTPTIW